MGISFRCKLSSITIITYLFTYLLITYHFHICNRFCGHSMGVIPGLVSIPVVKSFCVLFVYYGFLWEFHFAASFLLLQLLLTYLLIYLLLIIFIFVIGFAVIAWGLYLVSFRSQ